MKMLDKKLLLLILIICFSLLILIAGLTSTPSLGDEIYHFRFAKDAYNSNSRPAFDSQYETLEMPTVLYTSPPFWNLLLAILWKITGGISFFVAQLYQVIFYVIVIIITYSIGGELYSEKEAKISSLLVAAVPMIVSFSILLYTDISASALSLVGLLLTLKKKFLIAGLIWGLALLTKNNAGFFIPAVIILIFFAMDCKIITKLKDAFLMFLPISILLFIDFKWRADAFSNVSIGAISNVATGTISMVVSRVTLNMTNFETKEYLCSHLLNFKDLLMYFGVALIVLAIFYLLRKRYEKKDMYLGVFIISYVISTFVVIGWNTDIRYYMPIVPLLCILFSKSITDINNTWMKRLLICACIFQFMVTVSYVSYKRSITPQIEEAFNFIKNNTPVNSLLLYPEPNIQEYAQRKVIWSNFKQSTRPGNIFWPKDISKIKDAISLNNIAYIVIKKTRCYDDADVHHIGGYPISFVQKLPEYEFVKLIFDNKEIAIWEIQKKYL